MKQCTFQSIYRFPHLLPCMIAVLGLGTVHCKRSKPAEPLVWSVGAAGVSMPRTEGWIDDGTLPPVNMDKGGTVFRLMREHAAAGAPRIDVIMEPKPTYPTRIEEYLTRNLREMAQLEAEHKLRILSVDQAERVIADRKAYRVRHEYSVGQGNEQLVITQVTLFLVVEGRGVTVTAAGRTELYHPLAESVEDIFNGMIIIPRKAPPPVAAKPKAPTPEAPSHVPAPPPDQPAPDGALPQAGGAIQNLTEIPSLVTPIDLGTLGNGQKQPAGAAEQK